MNSDASMGDAGKRPAMRDAASATRGKDARTSVLFVCLGNICRSPLAEGIFIHHLNQRGLVHRFRVDSAGTGGWHAGERPDPRAIEVADRHGVHLPSLARQVVRADFAAFDHLVCMDRTNREDLVARGAPPDRLSLMLDHDGELRGEDVPDPYYGSAEDFERVFEMLDRACAGLVDRLTST